MSTNNMSVNNDREQFREYLQDSGAVDALSRVLMKLYELKNNRPEAAVKFIRENLVEELPSFAEHENMKKKLRAMDTVLEGLKKEGKLTKSQIDLIENISTQKQGNINTQKQGTPGFGSVIRARESQISIKTTGNISQIRKMQKADSNYITNIQNAIIDLKNDPNCNSLLKQLMEEATYNKYLSDDAKLKSFVDCICSGLDIHESSIGVYAADQNAYDNFEDLFNPIINQYHSFVVDKTNKHPKTSWGEAKDFKDIDPNKEFITSTRIRCVRNVAGFPLIPKMTKDQFESLCSVIKGVLTKLTGDLVGDYYEVEKVDLEKKKYLLNNRYILEHGDRFLQSAGAAEYWATGRAVFLNKVETLFIWVNEEDHLRFISMEAGSNIPKIYQRLIDAVKHCDAAFNSNYHQSEHLGYLTLCPTNLGNTIRASVMIKVPKLAKNQTLEGLVKKLELEIRGSHGQDLSKGEVFEISNKGKLGLTEYDTIMHLQRGIEEIIQEEKKL